MISYTISFMRMVIDTNVIYSALYSNKGASHALLIWLFSQKEQINVVSTPLINEFEDVLTRDENIRRFETLSIDDINSFIDDICNISYKQVINFLWRPFLSDINDDMVLETAFNARANYIVTHNINDFKNVDKYFQITIIKPVDLLIILRNKGVLI